MTSSPTMTIIVQPARAISFLLFVTLVLAGCGLSRHPSADQIALLAPFEGRYRDLGYAALYPARLALADSMADHLTLLPIDDGGSVERAVERAQALALDNRIKAVIVQGLHGTDPAVLAALHDLPVIVVGEWGLRQPPANVFVLSSRDIATQLNAADMRGGLDALLAQDAALIIAGDILALPGVTEMHPAPHQLTILTSGSPPEPMLRQRILASDPYAVEPNHLAMTTMDAVGLAAWAVQQRGQSRQAAIEMLTTADYVGYSGSIHFADGFWSGAPVNELRFVDGHLMP